MERMCLLKMPDSVFQCQYAPSSASSPRVCISLRDQGGQVGTLAGPFGKERLSSLNLPVKLKCFVVRFRWENEINLWMFTFQA
jgi:hypothetical protein